MNYENNQNIKCEIINVTHSLLHIQDYFQYTIKKT